MPHNPAPTAAPGATIAARPPFEYVAFGPVDIPWAQQIATVPATVTYGLRNFPSPADYHARVDALAAQPANPGPGRLAALAQRDWHVRGQTGCQFARLAARAADTLRWDYLVLPDPDPGTEVLAAVDAALRQAAGNPNVEIVSVLAPHATSPRQAVGLMTALAEHTGFWLEADEVIDGGRRLKLRYPVTEDVRAWVMAFGPWDFVPNTRRGPYLELAIRIKEKPAEIFHRLTPDRDVAHLADAPLTMSEQHWEDRWRSTQARTRMVLGSEPDDISAAKTTFTAPVDQLA